MDAVLTAATIYLCGVLVGAIWVGGRHGGLIAHLKADDSQHQNYYHYAFVMWEKR